jgi:hypothetical protein
MRAESAAAEASHKRASSTPFARQGRPAATHSLSLAYAAACRPWRVERCTGKETEGEGKTNAELARAVGPDDTHHATYEESRERTHYSRSISNRMDPFRPARPAPASCERWIWRPRWEVASRQSSPATASRSQRSTPTCSRRDVIRKQRYLVCGAARQFARRDLAESHLKPVVRPTRRIHDSHRGGFFNA